MRNMIQLPIVTAASSVVNNPPMPAGLFRGIVWENLGKSVDPKGSVPWIELRRRCRGIGGLPRLRKGGGRQRGLVGAENTRWKLEDHKPESQGSDSFAGEPMEDDAAGSPAGGPKVLRR